jgi:streptogramin lyase
MTFYRWLVIGLSVAGLSACTIGPPRFTPITDSNRRFEFEGFSVLPPSGADWFVFQSDRFSNPLHFGKDTKAPGQTAIATLQTFILPEDVRAGKTPLQALEYVSHMKREIQLAQDREKNRFSLVEWKDNDLSHNDKTCLGYNFIFEDRGVPGKERIAHQFVGEGLACLHTDSPAVAIVLEYSERFDPATKPRHYLEEGRRFSHSLEMQPLRYRIKAWTLGTSLQLPLYAHGALWISDSGAGVVHRFSPKDGSSSQSPSGGRRPFGLVELSDGILVGNNASATLVQLDTSGKIQRTVSVDGAPLGLARFGDLVAVCNAPAGGVTLLDAKSLEKRGTVQVTAAGEHLSWCERMGSEYWVSQGEERLGFIARIDPSRREVSSIIRFQPGTTKGMLLNGGRAWVTFAAASAVHAIDVATGKPVLEIPVGAFPVVIKEYRDQLWVSCLRSGSLLRLDPASGASIGMPLPVGQGVGGMTVAEGSLWAANSYSGVLLQITEK